mmetsp:Transcript_81435/g.263772  ORF Transcript_81435/g.263772 Transcript_81435/m.263772 type:complete len:450 (-) Transcript_81435:294-1643(-)
MPREHLRAAVLTSPLRGRPASWLRLRPRPRPGWLRGGLLPGGWAALAGRVREPEDRAPPSPPSGAVPLAASTEIEVEPSVAFRESAGRRHVGHRVASCCILAHCSKQAAWKTCEHLGMGRTVSPDLISSWQTVQTLSSCAISSAAAGALLAALPVDCPISLSMEASLTPMPPPGCSRGGAAEPRLPESAGAAASDSLLSSRTTARRAPQRNCRCVCCERARGTPRRQMSVSWKPSGRLPGPRSSSLSEDSKCPGPALICLPNSASTSPPASICLARRCARARDHLGTKRIRSSAVRNWMRPAARRWASRSVVFTSSLIICMRCSMLIQSQESRMITTKACGSLLPARHAHIPQNLALISTQPPHTKRPISGPCGSMAPRGRKRATWEESRHIGQRMKTMREQSHCTDREMESGQPSWAQSASSLTSCRRTVSSVSPAASGTALHQATSV